MSADAEFMDLAALRENLLRFTSGSEFDSSVRQMRQGASRAAHVNKVLN
jgi:hypothetical protein